MKVKVQNIKMYLIVLSPFSLFLLLLFYYRVLFSSVVITFPSEIKGEEV